MKRKIYTVLLLSTVLIIQACNSDKKSQVSSDSLSTRKELSDSSKASSVASHSELNPDIFVKDAAAWWAMVNKSAEIAQKKAENPMVKIFADQMVRDNVEFLKAFAELDKEANIDVSLALSPNGQQKLAELAQLSGKAFEDKYMMIMVEGYNKAVDQFKAATVSSDNNVKAFAKALLRKVEQNNALAIDAEYNRKI